MHSPAASHSDDDQLTRGAGIGRFVVLGLLGKGGMGEVYAAYDPELDRNVAIKLLRTGQRPDSAEGRVRLMREAQAIARVSHPNVVVIYDAGTFQERIFIAMELIEGHTLRYWMHANKRTWPEILDVFTAAGRGLAAAHERELVHRDFKPDNVMIATDGQVRVMDFGLVQLASDRARTATAADVGESGCLASDDDRGDGDGGDGDGDGVDHHDIMSTRPVRLAHPSGDTPPVARRPGAAAVLDMDLTVAGSSLGTPAYMSPEQFRGEPTDARTDQFSFCVALYEALYSERPFVGRSYKELGDQVVAGRVCGAPEGTLIPGWIRQVLLRGLQARPDARWPSMNTLLAELDKQPAAATRRRFALAAAAKLAGIWEAPRGEQLFATPEKAMIREAFLATGKVYAAKSCEGVHQILDRYAQRWCDLYVEACEASHVRGEQSAEVLDLRMACLQEGLQNLKALCSVFSRATPDVVENAINAANALGGLERCENVELLRAVVHPPTDPTEREQVAQLRTRLSDVRALGGVGRLNDALQAVASVEMEARRLDYPPLLADTLMAKGKLCTSMGVSDDAATVLEEAFWTALQCRHDEVAAEAATFLVYVVGYGLSRFPAAEIWSRLAETLIRRIGGHDVLWGWLLHHRSALRDSQGLTAEALEYARSAVAAKRKVLGPDHPDLGYSVGNVALYLDQLGEFSQAVEFGLQALRIVEGGLGTDHPSTAVILSNYGEFLVHVGRFEEAGAVAARARAIFDRETDREGLYVTYPLLALGLSLIGMGRSAEAIPVLERANCIRQARETVPGKRAEALFALAVALWTRQDDRARALALALQARDEYHRSPSTPVTQRELAATEAWLTSRA